ncbi:hypothetical protein Nepgr_030513 [Nepenthes gracilis]|uniref:Uncharacterized protein n=1 Tax=Nepenthes gracilis TaxID=150966 RepID=A0AAD3TER5_NEPGR|nr:hypothetical protein Nepgr_030513 [Nepenthes gracilis]
MEESNNAEIDEADGFSLLDVAVADDFLLVPSSDAEVSRENNAGDNHIEAAQLSQPSESFESKRPNWKGSFNLRKSLAWDSAFFTCAGVLNAEELSTIIEGSEMGRRQKQLLPGIQEDLNVSTDSISTFETESNSLTLESLEADLFCDVRALKQRSSKGPNLGSTISNRGHGETECNIGSGSKTSKSPSRNMVKTKSASKRLNASRQGLGKSTKLGSVPAQITKPVVRSRESNSLLPRHHKVAHKASSTEAVTAKGMSLGANRIELKVNNPGNAKEQSAALLKAPRPGDSRINVAKTVQKAGVPSCRSSCESSTSSSSENNRNCQLNILQKKVGKTVSLPFSSPNLKNPPKFALKNKSNVKSTPKISSSISPVSAIGKRLSRSSSSTATVNQKLASDQALSRHEIRVERMLGQSAKQALSGSECCSQSLSAKPSGLRMPSPKIGFFDGVKTGGGRTANGGLQARYGVPGSLPRPGVASSGTNGSSTNGRLGNSKLDTPKTDARAKQNENRNEANKNNEMNPKGKSLLEEDCDASKTKMTVTVESDVAKSSQEVGESFGHGTVHEKQDAGCGAVKEKEIICTEDRMDEKQQIEFNDFSKATPFSAASSYVEIPSATRTPFAVKNLIRKMEDLCIASAGSAMEISGKAAFILPSPPNGQKENNES